MNDKKFCFIICYFQEEDYRLLVASLKCLEVPAGYMVEVREVKQPKSIAQGYNIAMRATDAKYKIYLSKNVRILNKYFMTDILKIFSQNQKIGLMGVSGAKILPTNGIALKAIKRSGKILLKQDRHIIWSQLSSGYEKVQAIDGYLIATQYDMPWREDLFSGKSFYDTAQSVEFQRRGYTVAVAGQKEPWCRYDGEMIQIEEEAQQAFLNEYSKDIYPLVTIMIPTYNRPHYLKIALESALRQTYQNIEIVITDNSSNDETEQMIQVYLEKDKRITYIHHNGFNAMDNWKWAMSYNNSKAEYINWLMDDDVFHPEKIEKMLNYYIENEGITLVTSYRKLIDAKGNALPDRQDTKRICQNTSRIDGKIVGKQILSSMANFVGEPTTVLIKKQYLRNNSLGWSGKEGKYLITDFPTWLRLLSKGDMIYIAEPLSYFRIHGNQDQDQFTTRLLGIICWAIEIQYAWEKKIFIDTMREYQIVLSHWLIFASQFVYTIVMKNYKMEDIKMLYHHINKAFHIISREEN